MIPRRHLPRLALVVLLAAGAALAWLLRDRLDPQALNLWLGGLGAWAPVAYVAAYVAGTVAVVPGALFGLAGGALFGPVWRALLNLAGATAGATLAFLIARHAVRDLVARRAGSRLDRLVAGVEAEGWRFVAFLRLVPLFPFNLVNYALGLTRIGLVPYVVASFVCMAPGAFAYAWLGHAGRAVLAGDAAAVRYGLAGLGLLAVIVFLPRLIGRARRGDAPAWIEADALRRLLAGGDPPLVVDVREADEFTGSLGHIEGAVSLPLGELRRRLIEINAWKGRPVILVCRTDRRSARAATLLRDAGFRDGRVLRGGMERWNVPSPAAPRPS